MMRYEPGKQTLLCLQAFVMDVMGILTTKLAASKNKVRWPTKALRIASGCPNGHSKAKSRASILYCPKAILAGSIGVTGIVYCPHILN